MISAAAKPTAAVLRLGVYAVVTVVTALSTFLASPILLRVLGLEAFGTWSLIEPLVLAAAAAALLGSDHGLIKQISHDGHGLHAALGRLLPFALPVLLVLAAVAGGWVGMAMLQDMYAALAVAGLVGAEAILSLMLFGSRADNRLSLYALGQVGRSLLFLVILLTCLWFTMPGRLNIMDVVLIRFWVVAALATALALILRPRPLVCSNAYADAVRYGGFILLTSLLAQVAEMGDRFLLGWFTDRETVGGYVVYVKLTAFIGQGIITPFMLWFPVERFAHLNDPDGGSAFFDRAASVLLALMLTVGGLVVLAGEWLIDLFAPGLPYDPWTLALLTMAIMLVGMSYPMNVGLLKPGHTHLNLYPVGLGAFVATLSGAWLIPILGPHGAALGRIGGAAAALVLLTVLSQRSHRVMFNYGSMALLFLSASGLVLLLGCNLTAAGLSLGLRLSLYTVAMSIIATVLTDRRLPHRCLFLVQQRWTALVGKELSSRGMPNT